MFFIVGFSIAFFLLLLFFFKKEKAIHDYILAFWLGVIALHLTLHYLHYTAIDLQYPWLLGMILPLPIIHVVFLYFYTIALTENRIPRISAVLLHLIPFFTLIILAIPFYRLSGTEKIAVFNSGGKGFEWYSIFQLSFVLLTGAFYTVATLLKIRNHRKRIQNHLSNTDKRMLRWLEYLSIGLGGIWLLVLFFDDNIIFGGVTVFVLFIGFFGINQISIFMPTSEAQIMSLEPNNLAPDPVNEEQNEEKREKYAKSGLNQKQVSVIMMQLEQFMTFEKPFKESELTLNQLAKQMNLNPNQLSQVINSETGKTFYHYINTYRINEFLHLLSLPENKKFTFLALAYDCGFNSKTTFNKYFKIQTGKTPSEYFSFA